MTPVVSYSKCIFSQDKPRPRKYNCFIAAHAAGSVRDDMINAVWYRGVRITGPVRAIALWNFRLHPEIFEH